jgi:hypothetical protein
MPNSEQTAQSISYNTQTYVTSSANQGCTNVGRQAFWPSKFCMVSPNIFWSSAWTSLHMTFPATRIFRCLLETWVSVYTPTYESLEPSEVLGCTDPTTPYGTEVWPSVWYHKPTCTADDVSSYVQTWNIQFFGSFSITFKRPVITPLEIHFT